MAKFWPAAPVTANWNWPASGRLRRDARVGVVKPVLVRLLVRRAKDRILNRLNGNRFFGHGR
jgi:hypothetical protein